MKFTCLAWLIFSCSLVAQTTDLEQSTRHLFPEEKSVKWLRAYKGRLDDVNDVALVLAHDGKHICRGMMQYLRSKETLQLEGEWHDGSFRLAEVDSLKNISGLWEGAVEDFLIHATWTNFDNTIAKDAWLLETPKLDDSPTHCGDNKWIGAYAGDAEGDPELILQKGSDNAIWGIAYLKTGSFKVAGIIDDRNHLDLALSKQDGKKLARLTADFRNSKSFDASLLYEDRLRQNFHLQLRTQFALDCAEYADYVSSYDFSFPKTKNAAFNKWIEEKANEWINASRLEAKKGKVVQQVPELRATGRAFGWCEVEWQTESLISGFLTCQASWSLQQQGTSFNFDLKKGELLGWHDVFKPSFQSDDFVKNVVKSAFKNHALYESDAGFRQWVDGAAFPHFTLRKEGVSFSTDFNVLYGRQSLTVAAARQACPAASAPAMFTIQSVPNLSVSWPKESPHGACSSSIVTLPPSASLSQ